ncbi:MAG: hypothetical protein HYX69_17995 [Planctomycetia bacterium]|nr:hypothetical protein [Planctomycetia bacterium]
MRAFTPSIAALGAIIALAVFSPGTVARAADAAFASSEQSLSELIRTTIVDSLPREFTGQDKWGEKKAIASGLKFSTHGGRLKIDQRTKEVNHGLWTQYKATLIDPERHLRVRLSGLRRTAPGRLAFQLALAARVDGEARVERWRRGVKMLNFKAVAGSVVEAVLDCEVGIRTEATNFMPELVVEPHVDRVRLTLVDIDLKRVSKIGGDAAEELGDQLRHTLENELQAREAKVASKLNEALVKHPEKLRFSAARLVSSGWTKAQSLLSAAGKASTAVTPEPANRAPAAPVSPSLPATPAAPPKRAPIRL